MSADAKMHPQDDELVRRAQGGDDEAFRDLMETYKRRAYGVALGIVGDPDEAQDVVQDAFISLELGENGDPEVDIGL